MTGDLMTNLLVAAVAVATSSTRRRSFASATEVWDDWFHYGTGGRVDQTSGFIEKEGQMGGVDGVKDAELLSPQAGDLSQN
uniref:Secreted protein n=1 Tax=Romanomermis culicivorax TaxID=13658 RepID=A0A915KCT4_ROMCU